jgi:hypothetical protein
LAFFHFVGNVPVSGNRCMGFYKFLYRSEGLFVNIAHYAVISRSLVVHPSNDVGDFFNNNLSVVLGGDWLLSKGTE